MNVLVTGLGNIGTTLANVLLSFRDILSIDKVYLHKNFPVEWKNEDINILQSRGAIVCTSQKRFIKQYLPLEKILATIDYIFECRENGVGMQEKDFYKKLKNVRGVCAQGSEKGFGIPFMAGVNESEIKGEKFVQVISCNTHGVSSLLQTFTGSKLENLEEADFVIVRRSEDLGSHKKLVGANVIVRHTDSNVGTHHAIDVQDLFQTIGIHCKLTTSDISTPSQLMHSIRFHLTFKNLISKDRLLANIRKNEYVAVTEKFDSNYIFELGRRYGFQGRIYSQAIIAANNLLIDEKSVKGWAFVPQEGNTILSTMAAFLLQTEASNYRVKLEQLKKELLRPEW